MFLIYLWLIYFVGLFMSLSFTMEKLEKDPGIQKLKFRGSWGKETSNRSPFELSSGQLEQQYEMLQAKGRDQPLKPYQPLEKLMPFPWRPRKDAAGSSASTSTVITWQPTDLEGFLFCLSLKPSLDPHSQFGKQREAQGWQKLSGITGSPHIRLLGADGPLLVVM